MFNQFIEYSLHFATLVAALVGIVGHTWNPGKSGLKKLTAIGWTALATAIVCSSFSAYLSYQRHVEAGLQMVEKKLLHQQACNEIARALACLDFSDAFGSDHDDFDGMFDALSDSSFLSEFSAIDVRSIPSGSYRFDNGSALQSLSTRPIWETLEKRAKLSFEMLSSTMALYGTYIDTEAIIQVNIILNDAWFTEKWLGIRRWVSLGEMFERSGEHRRILLREIWFPYKLEVGEDERYPPSHRDRRAYLEFISKLRNLARTIQVKHIPRTVSIF